MLLFRYKIMAAAIREPKFDEEHKVKPVAAGAGISLEDSGFSPEKRKGHPVCGLGARILLMGVMAFGAVGCSKEAPKPADTTTGAAQEQVDKGWEARKNIKLNEAEQRLKDAAEIRNLRASGRLKPGQTPLKFGDMWIAPSDEPTWYRMTRANAAGIADYSNRQIAEEMAKDYNRLVEHTYDTKDGYQANLDRNNFEMLEKAKNK